jgi:hypothetical protein
MSFTEKQIFFVVLLGDIVEQSIRYTNLEQYEANIEADIKNAEIRKVYN